MNPDQFTTNIEYTIDHISKTKNCTRKTRELRNPFQEITHLLGLKNKFFCQMVSKMLNFFLQKWPYLHERCGMCRNKWKINFPIFAIFSLWDMVNFVFFSAIPYQKANLFEIFCSEKKNALELIWIHKAFLTLQKYI